MSMKWKMKYSAAAVLAAVAVISVALIANPTMFPQTVNAASFTVMLTDPPVVPDGTSLLNLTYSDVLLHVTYPNGTIEWLPVGASGTVNLFSLINMSQTIASATIPVGSAIDKIQFTITNVDAVVKGTLYNVTALSNTLVVKVANGRVNETLSGVLIDFNPTLVQIKAADANGTLGYYYVLVPSATAIVIGDLNEEQVHVGTIVELDEDDMEELEEANEEFSNDVKVVSASLSVSGNVTSFSVTLKNEGNSAARVFGLTLNGDFNSTGTWQNNENEEDEQGIVERGNFETIPFKLNGSSLTPLFGTDHERNEEQENDDENEETEHSALILPPGQSITLTFSDVIALQPEEDSMEHPPMVVTPIVGGNYTLRVMGEGVQTFSVTATS